MNDGRQFLHRLRSLLPNRSRDVMILSVLFVCLAVILTGWWADQVAILAALTGITLGWLLAPAPKRPRHVPADSDAE